ncbi:diguanylate cyclase [Piscinibacter sakaiensis]|uniref:GGDEF domain-containing protein n=1 Tax=Piscinibacter sakaiensis TaxID=1547922 RepID=A0A0K8P875_PISS1|nr:diguanylate cyclase [Piscinibacter sakaiensis]GAP38699.1 hypothetical protein ISF6_5252 [Piscinibacter sakaiensis]
MHRTLRIVIDGLDALGMGVCVFDFQDRALFWNRCFLQLFPEHAGHVHPGEPYEANLRRFYERRLDPSERGEIDRFIRDGVERHRTHDGAYTFVHGGRTLKVVARTLPGLGRLRIWSPEAAHLPSRDDGPALPAGIAGDDVFDHMTEGLVVFSKDGSVIWANEAFFGMYRLGPAQTALGRRFEAIYREVWAAVPPEARGPGDEGLAQLQDFMQFDGVPIEIPLPHDRWVHLTQSTTAQGVAYATHVEVTPLKRQQARLQEAQRALAHQSGQLKAVLEHMEQGVLLIGADGRIEVGNRRALELEGLPADLLDGPASFAEAVDHQLHHGELDALPPALGQALRAADGHRHPESYDRRRPNGQVVEVRRIPVVDGGSLRTYTDVTERRSQEARLRHAGSHDSLTQLVNRERFLQLLDAALQASSRRGDGVAVHFIDLDRFKPVNDTLGHHVGDRVLAEVARRLREVAREQDGVGRLGGDEFAVLQAGAADDLQACGMAERLLAALQRPMTIDGHRIVVGASIGIARPPADGSDAATLLRRADQAMYVAKARGCGLHLSSAGDARP